jgi:hypothetical protein
MKKKILNILILASIITTIGFLMDSDAKEPSMLMRFVEFFGMIGILFVLISVIYFSLNFTLKSLRKV